jgi:hypothetical protein
VNELNGWGYPISKLPGDNPLWSGPNAIKVRPARLALDRSMLRIVRAADSKLFRFASQPSSGSYVENAGYTSGKSVLPADWSRVGCIAEVQNGRALKGASWTSATMVRPFSSVQRSFSCNY